MSTPVRVVGFLAALAAVFVLSFGLGRMVGPLGDRAPSSSTEDGHEMTGMADPAGGSVVVVRP